MNDLRIILHGFRVSHLCNLVVHAILHMYHVKEM